MPQNQVQQDRGPQKPWALLAYIAGDNDLSDNGLQDINEMCKQGTSKDVYAGVEMDMEGAHTGSIRYEISEKDWKGNAHKIEIERLGERNTGDSRTLSSFLTWGLDQFNAQDHLVVIWGHGTGFRAVRRDVGFDYSGKALSSLDMPEVARAFERANINSSNPIAVLGFDACLMNMLEIAHHFSDRAKYLVGSQQTEPGEGWPYDKVLSAMNSAKSAPELAKEIVEVYIANNKDLGVEDVTQSAIDLGKTEAAVQALGELGDVLEEDLALNWPILQNIRMKTQAYSSADYVDLIYLAQQIADSIPDARVAAQKVISKTRDCILHSLYNGRTVENSNGLSVWFPDDATIYSQFRGKYRALEWHQKFPNWGWAKFLDAYHLRARLAPEGLATGAAASAKA